VLLPAVTERVRARTGRETFFYGNFVEDEGGTGSGWMTYPHHPRFGSNYRGLTGRCDLLLETYSYLPFDQRVATTYDFLVETLRVAGERGGELVDVVAAAERPLDRVAVRYRLEPVSAPARILTRDPRTLDGAPVEVTIPYLGRFVGTTTVERPLAYAVPEPVGRLLAGHGLPSRPLVEPTSAVVEIPIIEEVRETDSRTILEAPGELVVTARLERRDETLPAGMWLCETGHRLGAVAVYLCEADSDDGLIAAGLSPRPAPGDRHPAWRVLSW
jgi:hypothetical protein